jgi:hypothetical protein
MWIHEGGNGSNFKVQMGATRFSRIANRADHIPLSHTLPAADMDRAQVSI